MTPTAVLPRPPDGARCLAPRSDRHRRRGRLRLRRASARPRWRPASRSPRWSAIRRWSGECRLGSPTPTSRCSTSSSPVSDRTTSPTSFVGLLEAAAAIGARHVVGQLPDPDRSRAIDHFGRLCDLAGDFGLTVDLEFPSWMEVGDLDAAADVVADVGRSNAGIVVDALHFFRSSSSLEELASLPTEWFRFVQLCDAPVAIPPTVDEVIHDARAARVAARLRPAATRRVARNVAGRALRAGGAERRAASTSWAPRSSPDSS